MLGDLLTEWTMNFEAPVKEGQAERLIMNRPPFCAGTLPESWSNMTRLGYLDLRKNSLTGGLMCSKGS